MSLRQLSLLSDPDESSDSSSDDDPSSEGVIEDSDEEESDEGDEELELELLEVSEVCLEPLERPTALSALPR